MKTSKIFNIAVCVFWAVFSSFALLYLLVNTRFPYVVSASVTRINYLHNMFIAQLIIFLLTSLAVIAYTLYNEYQISILRQGYAKFVVLSEENTEIHEFTLNNKTSAILGKAKSGDGRIRLLDKINLNLDESVEKFAVINCVKNCWYIECLSSNLSSDLPKIRIALKRGGKQCVYKLELGNIYRLQSYDTIYIGKERLRFEGGRPENRYSYRT